MAGTDPNAAIQALYQQYGIQDGGPGSGFADMGYWAKQANANGGWSDYWNNRLGSDLAGTGTDQPTGTPGTGPWQNSGRGASTDPSRYAPPNAGQPTNPWQSWIGGMPKTGADQGGLQQLMQALASLQSPQQPQGQSATQPATAAAQPNIEEMIQRALMGAYL